VRFDGLPKAVEPAIVEALVAACLPDSGSGLRDYAILLLMARLGLRAVEVARLQLGDIDWRSAEITVHGKGGRLDRMPLPADVGEALARYIKNGRRATEDRAVFIQAIHEPLAMSRNAVVLVSRTASTRAGIAVVGAHRLRHTTGTELLRHGASLQEVGEVLRQSSAMTTSIYAKVDQASLALAVQPWPGR
jgi:integrase/recombinase XerD